jgi:hypothetical protein
MQPPWTFFRVGAYLLAGVIAGVLGGVIGFVVGAMYGGNYGTELEFVGLRGYEATGLLGGIGGVVTCGFLGFYFLARLTRP